VTRGAYEPVWLGVAGRPIAHSLSPLLHEAGLSALGRRGASVAFDVGAERFGDLLRWLAEAGWSGLNVTAPHKEAALRLAARASAAAARAGAANCLRFDAGGIAAANTDGSGLLAFLAEIGFEPSGHEVVLLGGGGAAAGLAGPLAEAGAAVTTVARRAPDAARFPALAALPRATWGTGEAERFLGRADLVIHATPLGRTPGDPLPCPPAWLRADAMAIDLVYGSAATPWREALLSNGRRAHDGLGVLLHQCAHSFAHWLGEAPPVERLREAVPWRSSGPPRRT
jgi:shikimate dehydrogenase